MKTQTPQKLDTLTKVERFIESKIFRLPPR